MRRPIARHFFPTQENKALRTAQVLRILGAELIVPISVPSPYGVP